MKKIEVHCMDEHGEVFTVNRFSSENAERFNEQKRLALIEKAKKFAGAWRDVDPLNKYFVAEI